MTDTTTSGPPATVATRLYLYVSLTLVAALVLVPLVTTALGGFKTLGDLRVNPFGLPSEWVWSNYGDILFGERYWHAMTLGVEYHHRLSVAEAASFCQKMPQGTIDFIEEAIRDETPSAYETLRKMTDIPFAIGEEFSSKWQFMPYIERDILQFSRIDICNVGGFTEAMKVAGWCEAHYVDLMPHNPLGPICTAASVHLAAAVANFAWLECRQSPAEQHWGFDNTTLFPGQVQMDGAFYVVPDAPGLGVDVDEAELAKMPFEYSEPPHLRRTDGSFTNW